MLRTLPGGFMGLQYNGPTHPAIDPDTGGLRDYPSSYAHAPTRDALIDAGVETVRVFLDAPQINPAEGVYDWEAIDTAVTEIEQSGMAPMLVLHQRDGGWLVGDAQNPWWTFSAGRQHWIDLAEAAASRYGDRAASIEILNEPNHIHPSSDSYMGFDRSADLFIDAANAIRTEAPDLKIGGPASFGWWEPATWAKRVLSRPGGEELLDFVSYHVYGTESAAATDQMIFDRAQWYETVPRDIRSELTPLTSKPIELALTEFNTSAVFQMNGELYTDPRNVDATGGVYAALGWLYSARGGADTAIRFGTTGGFGLIRWPAAYERQDAYHAVRLLHEVAGLAPGAELLETQLIDPVEGVEAFTLRNNGRLSLVLINTDATSEIDISIDWGNETTLDLYRYNADRLEESLSPLTQHNTSGITTIGLASRSVTVLRVAPDTGDFDGDGIVDTADHALWSQQYGMIGTGLTADANRDGAVDAADYTIWRDNLTAPIASIPEPSGLLILVVLSSLGVLPREQRGFRRR